MTKSRRKLSDRLSTYPVVGLSDTEKKATNAALYANFNQDETLEDVEKNIESYAKNERLTEHEVSVMSDSLDEIAPDGTLYAYRGIDISIDILKDIINKEGLQISKTEEQEELCFTVTQPYNKNAIAWADPSQGNIGVIFQIPIGDLKKNHIQYAANNADKVMVTQDIPAEIIQQSNIFIINYANKTLTKIHCSKDGTTRDSSHDSIDKSS